MNHQVQKYFPALVLIGIAINATGLFLPIIEPDGALYASIARHMATNNDWVNLIGDNHDWLDKPHFPFWITAFSFKIFGINSFAYKLPAFFFWLAGLRFTYLLGLRLSNKETAQASVLVYIVALHTVIANFDVRAEPYLTTLTIGSIYYFYRDYKERKWPFLFAAAFLAGCAVMTKGVFALLTIGGGFVVYWIITKQWKAFINPRWYVLVVLIFVFTLPELYCLYAQFDAHPEKLVFGRTAVSGIKFFFWDSQFGRFFNTGPIKGSGDPSFFLHTMLWAFLPWSLFLYLGIFQLIKDRNKKQNSAYWIIYASAGLTFILFSLSSFQLAHYIIIFFPQCSIIVAVYLLNVYRSANEKHQKGIHLTAMVLLIAAAVLVIFLSLFAHTQHAYLCVVFAIIILIVSIYLWRKTSLRNSFFIAYSFGCLLYLFLNLSFYPTLFQYQAGMHAAEWLNQNKPGSKTAMYKAFHYSFEFYARAPPLFVYNSNDLQQQLRKDTSLFVYLKQADADSLVKAGFRIKPLKQFDYFRITMLTAEFLQPATRSKAVTKMEVAEVSTTK